MIFAGRLRPYLFCKVLKQLRAAECILETMYYHEKEQTDPPKNQPDDDKIKNQIMKENGYTRTLLSDEIIKGLQKLKQEDKIDEETMAQFKAMFDPKQGIQINSALIAEQMDSYKNGLNEKGLFSLSLNSTLMKFFMQKVFYQTKPASESRSLKQNFSGGIVHHLVGTPGLGKTCNFIALKLLHDKRIPSLMKNGPQKGSIFDVNYKLFYLHSKTQRKQIADQILDEVKADFGQVPRNLKQFEVDPYWPPKSDNKFNQFISSLERVYQKKNIVVRFILDEVHELYDLSLDKRKFYMNNHYTMSRRSMPLVMISSRNDPYIYIQHDPIRRCACSTSDNFRKTIINNQIGPQYKLLYSMQCALFELQKAGKTRNEAVNILENIKNEHLYIGTHRSIAEVVKQLMNAKQRQSLSNQNQDQEKQTTKFKNFDLEQMKADMTFYKKKWQQNKDDFVRMQFYLKVLANSFLFWSKQLEEVNIRGSLKVINQSGSSILLNGNNSAVYKVNKMISNEVPGKYLSQINYFYCKKIYSGQPVFFIQSKKILSLLKTWSTSLMDANLFQAFAKNSGSLYSELVKSDSLFKNSLGYQIVTLWQTKKSDQKISILIGKKDTYQKFGLEHIYEDQLPSMKNAEQVTQRLPIIINKDRKATSYIKAQSNPLFDFIIFKQEEEALKIAFVNPTILFWNRKQIIQKKNSFKDVLIGKNKNAYTAGVKNIINYLSEECKKVEVTLNVLMPLSTKDVHEIKDVKQKEFTTDQIGITKKQISEKIAKVTLTQCYLKESQNSEFSSFQLHVNDKQLDLYMKIKDVFD